MNISISSCFNYTAFFKESILPPLTTQQKKVLAIASLAFGFLAACYLATRYYLKARSLNEHEQLIQKATQTFAGDPNKDAIVKRIDQRLNDIRYQETIDSGATPIFTFTWGDTLWGPYNHLSDQEKAIIRNATSFLEEHVGGNYEK
jgi:hypothetical protein